MGRTAARVVLATASVLVAACGHSGSRAAAPVDGGPLGSGISGHDGICTLDPEGKPEILGETVAPNSGPTAKVTSITVQDPQHLRLVAAFVVPVTNDSLGTGGVYPPVKGSSDYHFLFGSDYDWRGRQQVGDGHVATLAAGSASDPSQWNVVVVVQPSSGAPAGSFSSASVTYTSGGRSYVRVVPQSGAIREHCS